MKRSVKILFLALAAMMILTIAGCSTAKETSDKFDIGIIQYVDHKALDTARNGFVAALADNGFKDGEKITIDYQNAQSDAANLSTISDRFVSNKVDLVLAIATPAAQSVAGKTNEIPILGTAITDYEVARLVDSNEAPGGNVSGTTDMNPIKEQMDLLHKLAPDAKTIGVLYTSNEDNSILQAKLAREAIEKLGLTYVEVTVSNSNEVQQAAQSIVNKCDALYIPTDNIMASAFTIVANVAEQSKTPTICGESGMVTAGGLATLGINYYDLGYQTGLMAIKVLNGEAKPASMPIEASEDFDYAVNGNTAKALGVEIPADLQEYVIKE